MSGARPPDLEDLRQHAAPRTLLERALRADRRRRRRQRIAASVAGTALVLVGLIALVQTRGQPEAAAPTPIITAARREISTTLTLEASGASRVEVAGSWNGWSPERMQQSGGTFIHQLTLPPGRYEYMFLVDGHIWRSDPTAALSRDDGFGHINSILNI